jgi:hypothetical protein
MSNKGFNPLFLSALDILTGALGVFIVLNFLQTRMPNTPQQVPNAEVAKKDKKEKADPNTKDLKKTQDNAQPGTSAYNGTGRYKPTPPNPPSGPPPSAQPNPSTAATTPPPPAPPVQKPAPEEVRPQDPIAVDLMRQTQGATVFLMQQPDRAKNGAEFMLRQGNRTWKPTRASKYQDNDFQYNKALNYFYQTQLTPGMYEVLVRVKRNERSNGSQTVAFFGKILPNGVPVRTYNFGQFSFNGAQDDWVTAGVLTISSNILQFQPRLPVATAQPADNSTPSATNPAPSAPAKTKPEKGRAGKWGK